MKFALIETIYEGHHIRNRNPGIECSGCGRVDRAHDPKMNWNAFYNTCRRMGWFVGNAKENLLPQCPKCLTEATKEPA